MRGSVSAEPRHIKGDIMIRYVIKRLLQLIPVLLAVLFLVQLIMFFTPGDVTQAILGNEWTEETSAALRHEMGLDQPFLVQYVKYVLNILRGDFGMSYINKTSVIELVALRLPNTLALVAGAMVVCIAFSIPIGVRAAVKPNSIFSNLSTVIALIGIAMPTFWLGLLLILLFSVNLGWLPSSGLESFKAIILPSFALGSSYMASTMRTTRSSMLESLNQDYIRTAKAKGVSRRDVIYKHALKNSMLPTVTVIGTHVGVLIGGAVLTETVFSISGLGRLLIESIQKRDTPCVSMCLMIMAVGVGLATLATDLICAQIDPRIKAKYLGGRAKKK